MPDIIRGNSPQYIPVKGYDVIKPSAYVNSTTPAHSKGFTNSTGTNTLSGASAGSAFGPYGAAVGGLLGLGTDIWQAVYSKRRAEEANKEARRAAASASAQNAAEARAARAYNSEQAQIRRMRMAGLSPGLAYGRMSPSAAQPASAVKADIHKADTPKFDNESILHALQLLINERNAQTQALAQQSAAGLQGSQTQLNLIDSLYKGRQYEADISAILASKDKTDAEKLELLTLLTDKHNLLQSQAASSDASARLASASANVTEQTGVDLALSQMASNKASASLTSQQEKALKMQYEIDNEQWQAVQGFMKDYGYGEMLTSLVMKSLSSIAEQSGTTLNNILSSLSSGAGSIINNLLGDLLNKRK